MTDSLDDDTTGDSWNQAAIFWVGLFGIVATGAMVGVGGDNYWAVGHIDPPFVPWMQPFLHNMSLLLDNFPERAFLRDPSCLELKQVAAPDADLLPIQRRSGQQPFGESSVATGEMPIL